MTGQLYPKTLIKPLFFCKQLFRLSMNAINTPSSDIEIDRREAVRLGLMRVFGAGLLGCGAAKEAYQLNPIELKEVEEIPTARKKPLEKRGRPKKEEVKKE